MMSSTRRSFLATSLAASAGAVLARAGLAAEAEQAPIPATSSEAGGPWPIAIFEKILEGLSYEELADVVAEIGADGIEATIRPKGHIEPEAAADEVPKMVEALGKRGKRIIIAATGIGSVDEPHTEALLRLFKAMGIGHYRLAHYRYDNTRPLKSQVADFAAKVRDVAAMNKELSLQGLYQNHAGANYLGSLAWDAATALDGIDPASIGIACDLRHLRADTGSSWQTALRLFKPHIRSIYLKDGVWAGSRSDELKNVALDTGFVNVDVFRAVREGLEPMPLCIHVEYLGYRVFEKHEIPAAVEAHKHDLQVLREWMKPGKPRKAKKK
ncbi:MAG: sugar phosphate isomerase/epimerase family protein [Planctomycetota bacterium]